LNLHSQFDIPSEAVILLFLGRMTQIKRPDIAVDVLGAAQSILPDVHLIMVGPDEENWTTRLKAQALRLQCEKKIHFTGLLARKGVISALSQANLLLMPSEIQENFGNSALEAMAAGVPVLVSDGVPVGRWVKEACAGRVVPCTSEAFQHAALELLSNPEELRQMGKRGREMAQLHFDVSVVARQMLAQYRAIISTGMPLPEIRKAPS
jgi:glycosyltransferase involved in cell wall biosynthesis